MKITKNELSVLKAFADNEYTAMDGMYNDETIYSWPTWMFTIKDYSDLENASFPGVVGSLVKKGLVITDTTGDSYSLGMSIKDTWTMQMTKEGFDALQEALKEPAKENKPKNERESFAQWWDENGMIYADKRLTEIEIKAIYLAGVDAALETIKRLSNQEI